MQTLAVLLEGPERIALRELELTQCGPGDVIIDIAWSGVSSGTEKLLWNGQMPSFPGMGYPLVPGYESIGRIIDSGADACDRIGEWVFVPGANCYHEALGLFGGTSQRIITPSARALAVPEKLGNQGVLCALAATALHAIKGGNPPDLIIGHGVLGRLLARLTIALGSPAPIVWETNQARRRDARDYGVIHPDEDERQDYQAIYDASGDAGIVDHAVPHLIKGGEITLAGFYAQRVNFAFPSAFMKEARLRIAAEWQSEDLAQTLSLIEKGELNLANLISDTRPANDAENVYPQAFEDPNCLKMVLDWSGVQ